MGEAGEAAGEAAGDADGDSDAARRSSLSSCRNDETDSSRWRAHCDLAGVQRVVILVWEDSQ